jgi:general L-amino acid transport system permease protein
MSDRAFVASDLVVERPAPVTTTGLVGFVKTRLLNSPTNVLLTIASILLLWFTIIPTVKFLLIDAVWQGQDRTACLPENVGHAVGACWPFVQAKFGQFIYGFYPETERWRVNLALLLGALLLLPLLIPRLPAKSLNAGLFFLAFPVVAFFLLYGGGINGFGISWVADFLSTAALQVTDIGRWLRGIGLLSDVAVIGYPLTLISNGIVAFGDGLQFVALPFDWLRNEGVNHGEPVWFELAATSVIVSLLVLVLNGGFRSGWRSLANSIAVFAGIAVVIALLRLDRGGLPIVDTRLWGGLLVTLVVSITGIVTSMPVGIALALGRRSTIPLIRIFSIAFIEFWRGVPLITVLFFATYMLPLFLPGNFNVDGLVRVLIGIALFAGAYNAEVIRGGLQAIPRGQAEAASALGLSYWKTTRLVVMPQALRHVIPGLVNSFIALLKDTSLVSIVALFDLLGQLRASFADPNWSTPTTLFTGFAFTGLIYFVLCFGISRYSLFVEGRLNAHRRS